MFKDRPRLLGVAWFCLTMLAAVAFVLPALQLLEWSAPSLYADRLFHGAIVIAIVVPIVALSARLKKRWKEAQSR